MKFLSVRDLRNSSAKVWRELTDEQEMIVTSNGKPVALLTSVHEGDVEPMLAAWRQAKAARAVTAIQRQSVRNKTADLSMEEIQAEIRKTRTVLREKAS